MDPYFSKLKLMRNMDQQLILYKYNKQELLIQFKDKEEKKRGKNKFYISAFSMSLVSN